MKVFRLSKVQYSKILNGKGAAKFGNRWNSKGIEIIYTAESRALAMAEVAVHLSLATLPKDYVIIEIEIPDDILIKNLSVKILDKNWNANPSNVSTQKLGDEFIDSMENCVMKVPSAVVEGDFNFLINPYHPDFKRINIVEIKNFKFDSRLFE